MNGVEATIAIEKKIHFGELRRRRKQLRIGSATKPTPTPKGRVPRITRLMALAIHLQHEIDEGHIADFAEVARLSQITRARVSQIMNLNMLAPDIQEALLDLPLTTKGRDPIRERAVRPICAILNWRMQRSRAALSFISK